MTFDLVVFVSLPIMINFESIENVVVFLKCLHANMASRFLTSLSCLLSLTCKLVPDFPTYCFLCKVHSIR